MSEEMTYLEHIEGKVNHYKREIDEMLRNITLQSGDNKDDFLTVQFYNRSDVSDQRKLILKDHESNLKLNLKELSRLQECDKAAQK